MTDSVFVYGTLMQGERNAGLLAHCHREACAIAEGQWTMFDLGAFPAVSRGGGGTMRGEVYEVDRATLARLDLLEGVAHGLYRRERATVMMITDSLRAERRSVWVYVFGGIMPSHAARIASGDWRGHRGGRTTLPAASTPKVSATSRESEGVPITSRHSSHWNTSTESPFS